MARTYTTAERDHALDLYAKDGPAAAARATAIPPGTIRSWAKRSGVFFGVAFVARQAVGAPPVSFPSPVYIAPRLSSVG